MCISEGKAVQKEERGSTKALRQELGMFRGQ